MPPCITPPISKHCFEFAKKTYKQQPHHQSTLKTLEKLPYENSRRNPPGIQADSKRKGHGFEKILA